MSCTNIYTVCDRRKVNKSAVCFCCDLSVQYANTCSANLPMLGIVSNTWVQTASNCNGKW